MTTATFQQTAAERTAEMIESAADPAFWEIHQPGLEVIAKADGTFAVEISGGFDVADATPHGSIATGLRQFAEALTAAADRIEKLK